jgi:2-dehydropantoate 2-reductase
MAGNRKARVAVIGAGGIGAVLAEAAQAAGQQVTLCVRTPIPRLEVERGGEVHAVPVAMATDPARQKPVDWVLLATKAQDTASAAPWLKNLLGPGTVVVVAQNGIEHETRVRPLAGPATVLPALVYFAAERVALGRIRHYSGRRMIVPRGEPGAALEALLKGSLVELRQEADFNTAAWKKLMSNAAANPITTLTLQRIGVMGQPGIRELALALLRETAAVGRAAGATLGERDVEEVMAVYAATPKGGGSSMLYDRLAGRPLEHRYLTGAVVRFADKLGVPVPMNRAVLALLEALDQSPQGAGR